MARQPFFTGNYGSALAQVDTRPIMQGAAAQAAMYQGLGQNIGGAIEKYGLNKVKRAKLTGDIEAYLKENPDYINESTMTGDEAVDKKNMTENEKFVAGDLSMAGLEGLAGKLARGDTLRKNKLLEESQMMQNKMQEFGFGVQQELRETTIQLQKDKAAISSLSAAIAKETNPQRLELLQGQLASAIADLGENPAKRAERLALLEDSAATRVKLGGSEGVGDFASRKTKAGVEQAEASVISTRQQGKYHKSKGDTDRLTAVAKAETDRITAYAKLNPGFKAKYDKLESVKKTLLSDTLETPQGLRVTFKEYQELHQGDPQKYPMTGTAADLDGLLKNYDNQIQTLMRGEFVQANDTSAAAGAVGGGAGGVIPSVIDPGKMTQEQANTAVFDRKTEISNQIYNLQNKLGNIGTPAATMPAPVPIASTWRGYGGTPTYSGDQPATLGYDNRQRQEITTNIQALEAELKQLESYR